MAQPFSACYFAREGRVSPQTKLELPSIVAAELEVWEICVRVIIRVIRAREFRSLHMSCLIKNTAESHERDADIQLAACILRVNA